MEGPALPLEHEQLTKDVIDLVRGGLDPAQDVARGIDTRRAVGGPVIEPRVDQADRSAAGDYKLFPEVFLA